MTLKAISLFCGIGIADLALEEAAKYLGLEVEIVAAYDNWDLAVQVYNRNLSPVARVLDIKTLDVLPKCDFVFGGPPCVAWSKAGKREGKADPRDCTEKTWELIQGHHYLLENVRTIFPSPHALRYRASDFGDCTIRSRVFHSDLPIYGAPVLFPNTTISDIREFDEDLRVLAKRGLLEKAGNHGHYKEDEPLQSLQGHSWHGHDIRGGKLLPIAIRGYEKNRTTRILEEQEQLGSLSGSSWHSNYDKGLRGCRNPSILEMQRAHSIPEEWNWGKLTKEEKGKMIANSWPLKLGISVWIAFLENFI